MTPLDSDAAIEHFNRARELNANGDLEGATSAMAEAARLNPEEPVFQRALGYFRRDRRDFAGAIESFRAALQLNPDDANFHFDLGVTLAHAAKRYSDLDEAKAVFRDAIRLKPSTRRRTTTSAPCS